MPLSVQYWTFGVGQTQIPLTETDATVKKHSTVCFDNKTPEYLLWECLKNSVETFISINVHNQIDCDRNPIFVGHDISNHHRPLEKVGVTKR
jgi:hypothetical protein